MFVLSYKPENTDQWSGNHSNLMFVGECNLKFYRFYCNSIQADKLDLVKGNCNKFI